MPTLNETAEVLRLRAALDNIALEAKAIEAGYLPEDLTKAIDNAESALSADPGPLVAAVEGVVRALEPLLKMGDLVECSVCGHPLNLHLDRYGCEYEHFENLGPCSCDGKSVSEDNTREISDLKAGHAALAAYRAALGGTDA